MCETIDGVWMKILRRFQYGVVLPAQLRPAQVQMNTIVLGITACYAPSMVLIRSFMLLNSRSTSPLHKSTKDRGEPTFLSTPTGRSNKCVASLPPDSSISQFCFSPLSGPLSATTSSVNSVLAYKVLFPSTKSTLSSRGALSSLFMGGFRVDPGKFSLISLWKSLSALACGFGVLSLALNSSSKSLCA